MAIDSYSVGLVNREEEGAANGVRASAYRVALVCVGGDWFFSQPSLWNYLFMLAGMVFVILGFAALRIPKLSLPEEAREHWLQGFVGWAGTWRVIPLALFVLTYKLGEFAIGPMVKEHNQGQADELVISTAPVILGAGKRLFDGFDRDVDLEVVRLQLAVRHARAVRRLAVGRW